MKDGILNQFHGNQDLVPSCILFARTSYFALIPSISFQTTSILVDLKESGAKCNEDIDDI
jgi:hypothetical protein